MAYVRIRPRRSTKEEWEAKNPILAEGEIGVEIPSIGIGKGLVKVKIGDGISRWDKLSYALTNDVTENLINDDQTTTYSTYSSSKLEEMIGGGGGGNGTFTVVSEILADGDLSSVNTVTMNKPITDYDYLIIYYGMRDVPAAQNELISTILKVSDIKNHYSTTVANFLIVPYGSYYYRGAFSDATTLNKIVHSGQMILARIEGIKTISMIDDVNSSESSTYSSAKLDELFQSVSNGKTLIASAITDKGVETQSDATFQEMANNIEDISSGDGAKTYGSASYKSLHGNTLLGKYGICEILEDE